MRTIVGSAVVDHVEEHHFPVPLTLMTDDDRFVLRVAAGLPGGFLDPASMTFRFSNHSWVIQVDGLTVLVDPGTGNGRTGRGPGFDGLDTPYLQRLAELGTPADQIDIVFCTHLHHDHCGWNTTFSGGKWQPAFPNALYLFAEPEYRRWDSDSSQRHPNQFNPDVFDECVRPVVRAGQARIVPLPHRVSPSLTIEPAPGHTVGHAMLRLASGDVHAYFTGDTFHHPVQLARPELRLPGCDSPAEAVATRRALVQRVLAEDALLFPAHFPAPHYGRLVVEDGDVRFVPEN